jgi:hypothetical protein
MRSDHRDPAARTLGAGANAPAPTAGSLPSGTAFYVNPNSGAHLWDAANPAGSREATIASKVANKPTGSWFTTYNPAAVSWARLPAEGERGHLERPGEDQVEVVDAMGAG